MADALDSGSSEQYAHVGSSPVPRTIVKVAVRLLNSRERELHEALFSSTFSESRPTRVARDIYGMNELAALFEP